MKIIFIKIETGARGVQGIPHHLKNTPPCVGLFFCVMYVWG